MLNTILDQHSSKSSAKYNRKCLLLLIPSSHTTNYSFTYSQCSEKSENIVHQFHYNAPRFIKFLLR